MVSNKNSSSDIPYISDTDQAAIFPAPFIADSFNPYENAGDLWLYKAARGDFQLLLRLHALDVQQEAGQRQHEESGGYPSDHRNRIDLLKHHIQQRQAELDAEQFRAEGQP